MRRIRIGNRHVGEGEPCFIIAEAGVNHNGDIELAKRLIDVAKNVGADSVKFQTFTSENVTSRFAKKAEYQKESKRPRESQYEMIKNLELLDNEFKELAEHAKKNNIIFLSSPFDKESVDLLDELDVPAFKIGSGEITNYPLIKYISAKKKPIILSTGMSTLGDVEGALNIIKCEGVEDIVLLHCVSSYPANIESLNLRAIKTLKYAFQLPTGFSDHASGIMTSIAAVALNACIIEKHITLDKGLSGPDHKASLEPYEFREMVKAIRGIERALGDGIKIPTKDEEEMKRIARRSIVAKNEIPAGTIISEDMLEIKRPGTGIEARYRDLIISKRAKGFINKDEIITWNMIE